MLPLRRPDLLGGALSLSIHILLFGLAGLIALDQVSLPTYSSTGAPEPQTVTLRVDLRDRYVTDRDGTLTGPRSSLRSDIGARFPLPVDFSAASSESLAPALYWLVRHQNEDGSWSVDRFDRHCSGLSCDGRGGARCDDCVTALAVLALSAGAQDARPEGVRVDPALLRRQMLVKDAVSKGMSWLSSRRMRYGGCLGARSLADRLIHESWCGPLFLGVGSVPGSLMESQKTAGNRCRDGSWDPESPLENRVFLVAVNALRLEGHPDPSTLVGVCEGGYR